MDRKRLDRLRAQLDALRVGQHKAREFEQLAKKLGRKLRKRGKHKTWESGVFPEKIPVLSIPNHPGDMPTTTQKSILNHLESEDMAAWEERLIEEEKAQNAKKDNTIH